MTTPGARRHFPRSPTEAVGLPASHSTSTPGAAPLHHYALIVYDADVLPASPLQHQSQLGRHHSSLVSYSANVLLASSFTSTTKGEVPHLPSRLNFQRLPDTFIDIDTTRSGTSPPWSSTSPTASSVFPCINNTREEHHASSIIYTAHGFPRQHPLHRQHKKEPHVSSIVFIAPMTSRHLHRH